MKVITKWSANNAESSWIIKRLCFTRELGKMQQLLVLSKELYLLKIQCFDILNCGIQMKFLKELYNTVYNKRAKFFYIFLIK